MKIQLLLLLFIKNLEFYNRKKYFSISNFLKFLNNKKLEIFICFFFYMYMFAILNLAKQCI